MNVLLIQVPNAETAIGQDLYLQEPLALEYVGAGIPKEHQVKLLDLRLGNNLMEVLHNFNPQIVGFSGLTMHVENIKKTSKIIKDFNKDILVVAGGHHATILPQDFHYPYIDIIVIGEGIATFREIILHCEKQLDFAGIKGIALKKGEELIFTDSRPYPDLDSLPFPDRNLTRSFRHLYYSEWFQPVASIRTSKGCAFQCKFCSLWQETRRKYLFRAPEKIIQELKQIEESFVFFTDDESFLNVQRMNKLADLIYEEGIKKNYFIYVRADTIVKNPRLFEKWRNIGLTRALIGLESHREKDLELYNKKTTIEMNQEAIQCLHSLGISIYASFVVNPDFEEKDFDELLSYVKKYNLETSIFSILTPLPGSTLYEESKEINNLKNYNLFDLCHALLPTKLPLERFYREVYYLYLKCAMSKNRNYTSDMYSKEMAKKYQNVINKVRQAYSHHQINKNS